jgi:hypothetical protein
MSSRVGSNEESDERIESSIVEVNGNVEQISNLVEDSCNCNDKSVNERDSAGSLAR